MNDKKMNFEKALSELERISDEMKREDISLDDALRLFEDGQKRYRECSEILDRADRKIETFVKENGIVEKEMV